MKSINMWPKKTEDEWAKVQDNFWVNFVPAWFNWLGWVLILAVLKYVADESNSVVLRMVHTFSYVALMFYFQGFFYSMHFYGFPFLKSKSAKFQWRFSVVISGILSLAFWFLMSYTATLLQGKI